MTKQQMIKKIEQRAKAQMKANTLQWEIDKFFKSYGVDIVNEYFLCGIVALAVEPYETMLNQKELLNKIFKE